jgi:hypothetical protein
MPDKVTNVIGFDDILSTDHKLISFVLNFKLCKKQPTKRSVYNFKKANWNGLNEVLNNTPWDLCFVSGDVDAVLSCWTDFFLSAVKDNIPLCKSPNNYNHAWIDSELLMLIRKKTDKETNYANPIVLRI